MRTVEASDMPSESWGCSWHRKAWSSTSRPRRLPPSVPFTRISRPASSASTWERQVLLTPCLWTKATDPTKWLISQSYVWNGQRQGMRLWDHQIDDMIRRWNIVQVIYDPAAPMFAGYVRRRKGIPTRGADNDMGRGWPALNNALLSGQVLVHQDNTELLRECASIEWNEITGKPKSDQARHGADSLRYGNMALNPPRLSRARVAEDVR